MSIYELAQIGKMTPIFLEAGTFHGSGVNCSGLIDPDILIRDHYCPVKDNTAQISVGRASAEA